MTAIPQITRRCLPAAVGLLLLAIILYLPARHYGYIGLDDTTYVEVNPWVLRGLSGESIRWAFTTPHEAYWIPLTWISFMADVMFCGPGPAGHHLANILLHAINVLLLAALLIRFGVGRTAVLLVSALYAVHPVHVEPVVWVTGRKDLLGAFFWLVTIGMYREAGSARGWIALLGTAAASMCKPLAMTLPLVLLAIDSTRDANLRRGIIRLVPAFLVGALIGWIAFTLQSSEGATRAPTVTELLGNIRAAIQNVVWYAGKIVWPVGLGPEYPLSATEQIPRLAAIPIGLALVLGAGWISLRDRTIRVGLVWCAAALAPVIGFLQVGTVGVADRFLYVPMMGLALAGAVLLDRVPARRRSLVLAVAAIAVVALFGQATQQRARWESPIALFGSVVGRYPGHALAHNYLATALASEGRMAEARAHFEETVRLDPDHAEAHVNLAVALLNTGEWERADSLLDRAIAFKPDLPEAWFNRGLLRARQGRGADAAVAFRRVLDAAQTDPDLQLAACIELARTGDVDGATVALRRWLTKQPNRTLAIRRLPDYFSQAGVPALGARLRAEASP